MISKQLEAIQTPSWANRAPISLQITKSFFLLETCVHSVSQLYNLKKETLKKLLTLHYIAKIIIQRNVLSKLWSLGNFIPLKARTIIIFAKNLNARPYTSCALLTRYISRYLLNFRKITLIKNLVYTKSDGVTKTFAYGL